MTYISFLGIIFGISLTLIAIFSIIYVVITSKKSKNSTPNKEKRKTFGDIIIAITMVTAGIVITIISIESFTISTFYDDRNDVSNWVTLTVEIGVGIMIAVIILIYSRAREKEIAEGFSSRFDRFEDSMTDTMTQQQDIRTGTSQERYIDEI